MFLAVQRLGLQAQTAVLGIGFALTPGRGSLGINRRMVCNRELAGDELALDYNNVEQKGYHADRKWYAVRLFSQGERDASMIPSSHLNG